MLTEVLLTTAAGLGALVVYAWAKNYRWRQTINLIPGPPALPFVGNALQLEQDNAGKTYTSRQSICVHRNTVISLFACKRILATFFTCKIILIGKETINFTRLEPISDVTAH